MQSLPSGQKGVNALIKRFPKDWQSYHESLLAAVAKVLLDNEIDPIRLGTEANTPGYHIGFTLSLHGRDIGSHLPGSDKFSEIISEVLSATEVAILPLKLNQAEASDPNNKNENKDKQKATKKRARASDGEKKPQRKKHKAYSSDNSDSMEISSPDTDTPHSLAPNVSFQIDGNYASLDSIRDGNGKLPIGSYLSPNWPPAWFAKTLLPLELRALPDFKLPFRFSVEADANGKLSYSFPGCSNAQRITDDFFQKGAIVAIPWNSSKKSIVANDYVYIQRPEDPPGLLSRGKVKTVRLDPKDEDEMNPASLLAVKLKRQAALIEVRLEAAILSPSQESD